MEKQNNLNQESVSEILEREKQERDEQIKNTVKWGDKDHALIEGDKVWGVVRSIEFGRDDRTANWQFLTIQGFCTVGGKLSSSEEKPITLLCNQVLEGEIKAGTIVIGKQVAIQYLGTQDSKKYGKPYKKYLVLGEDKLKAR